MKYGVIILAAGESRRMGSPKQLLKFDGGTLLSHAVDSALASGAESVVVVLGANAAQIRSSLDATRVQVVENTEWEAGMGSSIRAGLQALDAAVPGVEAAVYLLCDQPHVKTETIHSLVAAQLVTGKAVIASAYAGHIGVPALFTRAIFPELLALRGPEGAKSIIAAAPDRVAAVPFGDGAIDIDTPIDYAHLCHPDHRHVSEVDAAHASA